jgi:hypothetical protein
MFTLNATVIATMAKEGSSIMIWEDPTPPIEDNKFKKNYIKRVQSLKATFRLDMWSNGWVCVCIMFNQNFMGIP